MRHKRSIKCRLVHIEIPDLIAALSSVVHERQPSEIRFRSKPVQTHNSFVLLLLSARIKSERSLRAPFLVRFNDDLSERRVALLDTLPSIRVRRNVERLVHRVQDIADGDVRCAGGVLHRYHPLARHRVVWRINEGCGYVENRAWRVAGRLPKVVHGEIAGRTWVPWSRGQIFARIVEGNAQVIVDELVCATAEEWGQICTWRRFGAARLGICEYRRRDRRSRRCNWRWC